MSAMALQITGVTIVFWTIYLGADQTKHQSAASLAFVRGIHRCFHLMTFSWLLFHKHDRLLLYNFSITFLSITFSFINRRCVLCLYTRASITSLKMDSKMSNVYLNHHMPPHALHEKCHYLQMCESHLEYNNYNHKFHKIKQRFQRSPSPFLSR